ncbi:hypothetical protein EJB05_26292, partial [Eragrostis curvula]
MEHCCGPSGVTKNIILRRSIAVEHCVHLVHDSQAQWLRKKRRIRSKMSHVDNSLVKEQWNSHRESTSTTNRSSAELEEDEGWTPVHRVTRQNQCTSDPIGDRRLGRSRFWALEEEDEDGESEVTTPSTEDVLRAAKAAGFSIREVARAEKELLANEVSFTSPATSNGKCPLARKIVRSLASDRPKSLVKPWKGPLPPKRISPPQTIGDAVVKNTFSRERGGRLTPVQFKMVIPSTCTVQSESPKVSSTSHACPEWPSLRMMERFKEVESSPEKGSPENGLPEAKMTQIQNLNNAHLAVADRTQTRVESNSGPSAVRIGCETSRVERHRSVGLQVLFQRRGKPIFPQSQKKDTISNPNCASDSIPVTPPPATLPRRTYAQALLLGMETGGGNGSGQGNEADREAAARGPASTQSALVGRGGAAMTGDAQGFRNNQGYRAGYNRSRNYGYDGRHGGYDRPWPRPYNRPPRYNGYGRGPEAGGQGFCPQGQRMRPGFGNQGPGGQALGTGAHGQVGVHAHGTTHGQGPAMQVQGAGIQAQHQVAPVQAQTHGAGAQQNGMGGQQQLMHAHPVQNTQLVPPQAIVQENIAAPVEDPGAVVPEVFLKEKAGKAAVGEGNSGEKKEKPKFCFRCYKPGHKKEECTAKLLCGICLSTEHLTAKCTVYKNPRQLAHPCGFEVAGLGFHHIPHAPLNYTRNDNKTALVKRFYVVHLQVEGRDPEPNVDNMELDDGGDDGQDKKGDEENRNNGMDDKGNKRDEAKSEQHKENNSLTTTQGQQENGSKVNEALLVEDVDESGEGVNMMRSSKYPNAVATDLQALAAVQCMDWATDLHVGLREACLEAAQPGEKAQAQAQAKLVGPGLAAKVPACVAATKQAARAADAADGLDGGGLEPGEEAGLVRIALAQSNNQCVL